MKIYRAAVEIHDLVIDSSTKLSQKLMGEDIITLSVVVDSELDIQIGDYTTFEGHQYEINRPVKVRKLSEVEYRYDIEFESCFYRLLDKIVLINGKSETSLYGTLEDFVDLIVANLNTIDTGWTKGTVYATDWKNMTVDGTTCKELLDTLASSFSVEYSVVDKTISAVERVENATAMSFEVGKAKGLYELTRQKVDNENTITRAYFFGGSKNLDYNYRSGEDRLVFVTMEGKKYLENTTEYSKIVEQKVIFEDIYPRFTGVVSTVSADKKTITDTTIDFDLSEYIISGVDPKIVFTSGDLMGVELKITGFDFDTNAITFEATDEENGLSYPNTSFYPKPGDTYTLVDIAMPTEYIEDAEAALYSAGTKWLDYYSQLRVKYSLELDARYIRDNAISLSIGDVVNIKDAPLGIDKDIRIVSLTKCVDGSKITAEISNYKEEKQLSALQQALNDTVQQLIDLRSQSTSVGLSLTNIQEILANYTPAFNQITGLPTDNQALNEYLQSIGVTVADTTSKIISGDVIWKELLKFEATDFVYKLLGVPYTSASAGEYTHQDADPTYGRFDAYILDTFSNLSIRTGTPSAAPQAPTIYANELLVKLVYIPAGALVPDNITVEVVYDENAAGEWTPTTYAESGKTTVNLLKTTDPYIGIRHIQVDIAVPDTELVYPSHYIGQKYQGGKIFYIDPTSGGKKGLIAAEYDTVTDVFWSRLSGYGSYSTGGRDASIGAGQANSAAMLATPAAAAQAIRYVDELIIDGYSDWFMGSEKEMQQLWKQRNIIGRFNPTKDYWTSTERDWNEARRIDWETGGAASRDKNTRRNVRAIRAFDDTGIPSTDPVENYTPNDTSMVFEADGDLPVASGIFSLKMKTTATWNANSMLVFELYKGAVRTGSCAMCPATNLFGFKPAENESYQMVALNLSNFAATQDTFNALKISLVGSWPNNMSLLLDDIRFQYSDVDNESYPAGTYGSETQTLVATINPQGKVSEMQVVNNVPYNGTVSYEKAATTLTSRVTNNTGAWDLSAQGIVEATISTGVTVSLSNLQENKAITVKLTLETGGLLTLPSYCKLIDGSVDLSSSPDAGTYIIDFHCLIATEGSEFVRTSIGAVL